ncbi:MAG: hypothetical protein ACUVWJ_09160 [Spirochaetota bacterium]
MIEFRFRICECTINFLEECNHSDKLLVRTLEPGRESYLHGVVRVKDGVEVCRVLLRGGNVS